MATTAAQAPFQMPQQPIAGFSPDQLAAFQATNNAQGMAQPYFQQGANYINQSAQPLTADQINNFYNPMASNVFAALNNSQAQQMQETTGQLTQAAGGVGADRIAVGQGELAKQQQLAQGQTAAGLYQSALGAAQQNQQMQAGAGYGLANIGAGMQGAQLQGIQAQLGTGGLQQQQQQAQLNSPYQQQLAQIAYPFQTAQYLAGVTGGLSGALGGTTTGQGTTTYPAPSLFSQIAGAGTAGIGLLGGTGAFGANGYLNAGKGSHAAGGRVGYAGGGDVSYQGPYAAYMAGSPSIVPSIPMQMGNIPHPQLPAAPQMPQQQQGKPGGGFLDSLKGAGAFGKDGWLHYSGANADADPGSAANPLPGLTAEDYESAGGAVSPYAPMQGYADGGDAENYTPLYDANPNLSNEALHVLLGTLPPSADTSKLGLPDQQFAGSPASGNSMYGYPGNQLSANPAAPIRPADVPSDYDFTEKAAHPPMVPMPGDNAPRQMQPMQQDIPPSAALASRPPPQSPMPPAYAPMPESETPYPRAREENMGTNLARSPWLALAQAGFGMMAGTSPYAGVNIGKGAMEGVKELQTQRSEAQKEESANLRAKQLWEQSQQHLKTFQHSEDVLAETRRQHDIAASRVGNYRYTPEGKLEPIPGGPADPETMQRIARAKVDQSALWSDDTVQSMAEALKAGDRSVFTNSGMGAAKTENIGKVWNKYAEMLKAEGKTGADIARARADFTALSGAARVAATRSANVAAAVEEARNTFPLALSASEAVPRGDFVPVNRAIQMWQAGTSSPELATFATANQAVITAYSQAMSRTGVNTVHAQQSAEKLLSTATSPEAYKAVLMQMEKEMQAAVTAPDAVRSMVLSRIGMGATGQPLAPAPTNATGQPPAQQQQAIPPAAQREIGKVYQTPKGPFKWGANGWEQP